ncbi:hypothetical protein Q2298_04925 [Rhodococcus electrodiphilus]|nr:hypothetical protein [Rhodococcus ruber]MDO2377689.1 hypothetical protein [Rhodococcus ruber]
MSWSGLVEAALDVHLTTTAAAVVFVVLAVGGFTALVARRSRRWLVVWVPVAVVSTVVLVLAAAVLVEQVWRPFPDRLPRSVYVWSGLAVLAIALGAGRWVVRHRDRRPLAAAGLVVAVVAVVVAAAGQVNAVYDAYPTVRAALGLSNYRTVPLAEALGSAAATIDRRPLSENWTPRGDLPETGAVTTARIPGAVSGFRARDARISVSASTFWRLRRSLRWPCPSRTGSVPAGSRWPPWSRRAQVPRSRSSWRCSRPPYRTRGDSNCTVT